jgi:SAM-dependent methyltransferase
MASNAFTAFEHEGWQRAADFYAGAWGSLTRQAIPALLDAAGVKAGTRVLDVACGPGFAAGAAATRGAIATGLDFSAAMIAQAKRDNPGVTFREGSAEELPFEAASFDAVVINFGLFHFEHPDRALAEAKRVLREGGRVAFSTWAVPKVARVFGIVLESVQAHGRMDVDIPTGPGFFNFSEEAVARGSLEQAGFEEVTFLTVPMTLRLDAPTELFAMMQRASVRTAALLKAQAPGALARIGEAITQAAQGHLRDGQVELPADSHVVSGRKHAIR